MKLLSTLICLLLLTVYGLAQDNWQMQTSGTDRELTDVCFIDQNTGWVSGWTGTILHTDDGGATWTDQDAPPTNAYYSVFFTDDQNGWACGYAGKIIHTSDGGQTWEVQSTPSTEDLYSIYFMDNMTGWAAGGDYKSFPSEFATRIILNTTDGGVTWTSQSGAAYKEPLKSIRFIDQDHGFSTGGYGTFMKTSDGGANWTESTVDNSYELRDVYFTDMNTGWVCGDYLGLPHHGGIFKTTDGGSNWTEEPLGTDEIILGLYFMDNNTGWAVGNDWGNDNTGIVFKTTDGGENWVPETLPANTDALFKVVFTGENPGWAVGHLGTIVSTFNGSTVGIDEELSDQGLPENVMLQNNYPNPFSSQTKIDFQIPKSSKVSLKIYSLTGQLVKVLADENVPAGGYSITWDGNNDGGQQVNSGLYFCRLNVGGEIQTKRMSLVR